jgi:hypothetical protein
MPELPRFQSGQPLEDQVTADRMNAIVDNTNANTLQQGVGIRISRTGSNTTIAAVKNRLPVDTRPFMPTLVKQEDDTYKVRITRGFLAETQLSATASIIYHEPSDIYESDAYVYQTITLGQAGYIQADVGIDGRITGTTAFVIDNDNEASVHYFPAIGDYAGAVGSVYYKLFTLNATTGVIEKVLSGQDLLHYAERFAMTNLTSGSGTIYKVLKDYNPATDTVNFRTLSQLGGSGGQPIIKAGTTDSIEFRRIKEKSSDAQVKVSADGDDILVRGNGIGGDNAAVTVVDGLVTVLKSIPTGIDYELTFSAGSGEDLIMTWTDGILTSATFDGAPSSVGLIGVNTVTA